MYVIAVIVYLSWCGCVCGLSTHTISYHCDIPSQWSQTLNRLHTMD